MGNDICCQYNSPHTRTCSSKSISQALKNSNEALVIKVTNQKIKDFHQNIVSLLIDKKLKVWNSSLRLDRRGTEDDEKRTYQLIKQDLQQYPTSFFPLLIQKYFAFLRDMFKMTTEIEDQCRYIDKRTRSSEIRTQRADSESVFDKYFQKDPNLAKELLKQLNLIIKMLYFYLDNQYNDFIVSVFPDEVQSFKERELVLQRLIQYQLFDYNGPLHIVHPLLLRYYYNKHPRRLELSPRKLSSKLIPFKEGSTIYPAIFVDSNDAISTTHRVRQKSSFGEIPYKTCFHILENIINTNKPWLKFKHIEQLHQLIFQIYLNNLTNSDYQNAEAVIQEQDSQCAVLEHMIKQFIIKNDFDYQQACLELHWMMEDNAVLSHDTKNIYSPQFLKFYGLFTAMEDQK